MPIPSDLGECIEHFKKKGKPYKQALAICLSERGRRREKNVTEAFKKQVGSTHRKE